jgi:hypothetical protein
MIMRNDERGCGMPTTKHASTGRNSEYEPADVW